ncbi:MAG: biotin/lipoyl-binding protein, partial [Lachnospiraceae bacterium]
MEGAVSKIQSATAQVSQIDSTVSGTGNISIGSITNIKAPVGLTVSEVYVESGDTVKKGQKLVKIDKLSVVNALLEAQGQLEDVEDELDEDDLSDLEEE